MWKCESCGFVNGDFNKLTCKKCKSDNPQFIYFSIAETPNVKKHIDRLYNRINKITNELCDIRDDWEYHIEEIEDASTDVEFPSVIQRKTEQLSRLKDVTQALDNYISDLYSKVEEKLEDMTYHIESCIEMDNDWETEHLKINEVISTLKECLDDIYPLIIHAESINNQKRGLSSLIKRLSKFALDLQNALDVLYVEVPKKEFVESRGLTFEILDDLLLGENNYFCVAKEKNHNHLFVFNFIEDFKNYKAQIISAINNIPKIAFEFLEKSLYEHCELCIRIAYNSGETTGFELYDNLYNSGYLDNILTTQQLLMHLGKYRGDLNLAISKYCAYGSLVLWDDYRNAIKESDWKWGYESWNKSMIIPNVIERNLSIETLEFNQYYDENIQWFVNESIALHQQGALYFYQETLYEKTIDRLEFIKSALSKISSDDLARLVELLSTYNRHDILSSYPVIKVVIKYDESVSCELYECEPWKISCLSFKELKEELDNKDFFLDLRGNRISKTHKMCPVCLRQVDDGKRCPHCKYSQIDKVYATEAEKEQWTSKVIVPWRNRYLEQLEEQLKLSLSETEHIQTTELQEYLVKIKEECLIENITEIEFTEDLSYPHSMNMHIYTLKFDEEELVAEYTHKYSESSKINEEYGIYETKGINSKEFLRKLISEEKIYQLNTLDDETIWYDAASWCLTASLKHIYTVKFDIGGFGWFDSKMLSKLFKTSLGNFFTKKPNELKMKNAKA